MALKELAFGAHRQAAATRIPEVDMAPQVVRIAIVFGAFILLFLGIRSQTVPAGFGVQGFHRDQAPAAIAASKPRFAGATACNECHPDKPKTSAHAKKGVHCESCHGPSQAHVDDWESFKPKRPSTRADCAICHARIVSRPDWFKQIDPKTHNPESRCVDCHVIHPAAD